MRCPFCGNMDSQVKDSRPSEDGVSIRRRRMCPECGARFTTYERVQLRELMVRKSDGRIEPFDPDKVKRSLRVALRKRPVHEEQIERAVNSILRQLEAIGEAEIPSSAVGEKVMQTLLALDKVAYIRFASVYKDFQETTDFHELLDELKTNPEE